MDMSELDDFPRRNRLDKLTPAELAIWNAKQAVESLPPDVRLTEAVILLDQAQTSPKSRMYPRLLQSGHRAHLPDFGLSTSAGRPARPLE